jgi:hypothetical protein
LIAATPAALLNPPVFAHGDENESAENIQSQIAGVHRATRRYFDVQTAVNAGYAAFDPTQFIHTQSD